MIYQQNPSNLYYLTHWIVAAVAVLLTAKVISGFRVSGFFSALIAALMIAIANYFVWPVLIFLTLPLNMITLGFFTFIVNGIVLKIASWFVPGFHIDSFLAAIFGSLLLAIISGLMHFIFV